MTSEIEYKCNNCGHEGINTRAVPDVPELVRYDLACDFDGKYHPDIIEVELGDYVRYDQAAAIIAAQRTEINQKQSSIEFYSGIAEKWMERALKAERDLIKLEDEANNA